MYLRFLQSVYEAPDCFAKPDHWKEIVDKEKK